MANDVCDRDGCDNPTEKDARGWYRSHCPTCIEAAARDRSERHVVTCEADSCPVCISYRQDS